MTVAANTKLAARRIAGKPHGIRRCHEIPHPGNPFFYSTDNFVYPGNDNDMVRAITKSGYAISITVEIDELPIFCNRIGSHQKVIGKKTLPF